MNFPEGPGGVQERANEVLGRFPAIAGPGNNDNFQQQANNDTVQ